MGACCERRRAGLTVATQAREQLIKVLAFCPQLQSLNRKYPRRGIYSSKTQCG
jgi:hypothetical protein